MILVHNFNKDQIKKIAIQKRDEGLFFKNELPYLERNFLGSIDRFCEIAYELRFSKRILDAGSGYGLLPALLSMLGHETYAVDIIDHSSEDIYLRHKILFNICNIEVDTLPFETGFFDAITCCQALEHFTHSHLGPLIEMRRVLKEGGLIELDVPNVVSFRNRSRILRGKNITYDYKKHYLYENPIVYKGREYYPNRHNREFTKEELKILLSESGFKDINVRFLKSQRYRTGIKSIKSLATILRDLIPQIRKTLIAFARK